MLRKRRAEDFIEPICVFKAIDLEIALGLVVKTASNVNSRLMYMIGTAEEE